MSLCIYIYLYIYIWNCACLTCIGATSRAAHIKIYMLIRPSNIGSSSQIWHAYSCVANLSKHHTAAYSLAWSSRGCYRVCVSGNTERFELRFFISCSLLQQLQQWSVNHLRRTQAASPYIRQHQGCRDYSLPYSHLWACQLRQTVTTTPRTLEPFLHPSKALSP